uniref:Major facilitator superfamily (MFS) profile domain-containing protein n=1 Tax=Psilocybe cubensis TaxID=181762 RepID=A0A8H8CF61_PSICU
MKHNVAEKDPSYSLDAIVDEIPLDNFNKGAQDEALGILSLDSTKRHYSAQEDARLLRKIDRHIMPIIFFIYFLQLVDKQILSFSSVFGLSRDADLVGDDYSLLGSIVYIAQLVMQPLSSYLLVKFRLSIYVPLIVTCWGATLLCMTAAKNFVGLLIARFFLGAFEASVQASFILVIQFWYRRKEQGFRLAGQ